MIATRLKPVNNKLIVRVDDDYLKDVQWILFELMDHALVRMDMDWRSDRTYEREGLKSGLYVIKISSPTGEVYQQVVEVNAEQIIEITLGKDDISYPWDFDIVLDPTSFNKAIVTGVGTTSLWPGIPQSSKHMGSIIRGEKALRRLWKFDNGVWRVLRELTKEEHSYYSLEVKRQPVDIKETWGLEAHFENSTGWTGTHFYIIPPGLVTFKMTSNFVLSPRSVNVDELEITTHIPRADALAQLLNNGETIAAKSLVHLEDASQLMEDKETDHAAAAIGGYYLLRADKLEYLYNWTENLANWFPEMADGAIIHAWFLLQSAQNREAVVWEFRSWLLEAVRRGVPLYSEGLRLLYEGLTQIHLFNPGDRLVSKAREKVGVFVEHMVNRSVYTTMRNYMPVENSSEWKVVDRPQQVGLAERIPVPMF